MVSDILRDTLRLIEYETFYGMKWDFDQNFNAICIHIRIRHDKVILSQNHTFAPKLDPRTFCPCLPSFPSLPFR